MVIDEEYTAGPANSCVGGGPGRDESPGRGHHRGRAGEWSLILREFLRDPRRIGAIAPSSRWLAAAMVEPIARAAPAVVVEIGAGTGAVTRQIEPRLAGRGRQIAVEINPKLARHLADRHRGVRVLAADAERLPAVLAQQGVDAVDVIVCCLPWAAFAAPAQTRVLAALSSVLAPDGVLTTFAYRFASWTPSPGVDQGRIRRIGDQLLGIRP